MLDRVLLLALLLVAHASVSEAQEDWKGWGGPHGNFRVAGTGVAARWSAGGPAVLWRRQLGDHGHSAIVSEGQKLYTMLRRGDRDVVICLDAATGETIWEHAYEAPLPPDFIDQFGPGPHSTPLLVGDRLFSVGSLSQLESLDKATGDLLWRKDLRADLEAPLVARGYGASPLAWNDLVILPVGGNGQGIMALRQSNGEIVWRALDGRAGYSSPILATVDGKEQLVAALGSTRAGLEPATGRVLWQLDLPETAATIMSTQVQVGDHLFFTTSAYADGSRVYSVERDGDGWKAEERWYNRKMGVMHGTVAQFGDFVYGSSGDFGPTFLAAVDIETGELAFRARGFAKANLMRIGDKVLILDEDGQLALGAPSPEGIEILTRAEVIDGVSWTAPTVVGTRLYLRNRTEMLALDLSVGDEDSEGDEPADLVTEISDVSTSSSDRGADRVEVEALRVPERSVSGQTLAIPPREIERGLAYYVMPGDDAQVLITSKTSLQKTVVRHNRVVGYLVAPFDLDQIHAALSGLDRHDAPERMRTAPKPVLSAAFRLPVKSLSTGSSLVDPLLRDQLLDSDAHPEITFRLKSINHAEALPLDDASDGNGAADAYHFRVRASGRFEIKGQELEIELPADLVFRRSSNQTMNRFVGDLAFLESHFELDLERAGIAVPPMMAPLLSSVVEVDLYLAMSTVTPDKSLVPFISQEAHQQESLILTWLRDLEDPEGGYRLGRRYVESTWDDADALYRVASMIATEPDLRHRDWLFALEVIRRCSLLHDGQHAPTLDLLATIQSEMGDLAAAIVSQRLAIEKLGGAEAAEAPRMRKRLERLEARLEAAHR